MLRAAEYRATVLIMKKTDAIALAGSPGRLAEILGISRQAVSKWPGEHVPELQLYRLRERKPRWFRKPRAVPMPAGPDVAPPSDHASPSQQADT